MKKQPIIFRADGNSDIGLGHIIRSLALSDMLKNDFECIFATRFLTQFIREEITKACHSIIQLSTKEDDHFQEFINALNGNEIVVLDNYFFSEEYQLAIKSKGCKLVCIDDIHDKHYVADLVINHAPLTTNEFSISVYTKLLLGFEHALLRAEFLNSATDLSLENQFKHAFICYGGADINNLTSKTLLDISGIEGIEEISIVIGGAYAYEASLQEDVNKIKCTHKINLYKNINSHELVSVFNTIDFAIVPCSTILYEALSQGVPVITGYYVDNQLEIANCISNNYMGVIMIGDLNNYTLCKNDIIELESSIKKNSNIANISSKAKDRFIKQFKKLSFEYKVNVRRATVTDADLYFEWANDAAVRQMAISQEQIKYNDHVKWFGTKIRSNDSCFYVFNFQDSPIGQVRFDLIEDYCTINYSISKEGRGKGIGGILVKKALEEIGNNQYFEGIKTVVAIVKPDNIPSYKIFQNLTFNQMDNVQINGEDYLRFEKSINVK